MFKFTVTSEEAGLILATLKVTADELQAGVNSCPLYQYDPKRREIVEEEAEKMRARLAELERGRSMAMALFDKLIGQMKVV